MKPIVSRRYYPVYYGQESTNYSFRSYYIGKMPRKGTADQLIGYVPDTLPNGWVDGKHFHPARILPKAIAAQIQ